MLKSTADPGIKAIASFEAQIEIFKGVYVPDQAAIDNQKPYHLRVQKFDNSLSQSSWINCAVLQVR